METKLNVEIAKTRSMREREREREREYFCKEILKQVQDDKISLFCKSTPKTRRPELVSGPQKAFTLAEVLMAKRVSDKTCSQEFVRMSKPKAPTNIINKLCAFTLAEVTMAKRVSDKTCSQEFVRMSKPKAPTNIFNKLCAFTLAEVLITLAIIGVVAALTIPTVVNNYRKSQYVNQLKVGYSTITQMFMNILAHDNTSDLAATSFIAGLPRTTGTADDYYSDEYTNYLKEQFSKHAKLLKVYRCKSQTDEICAIKTLNGEDYSEIYANEPKFYFANGMSAVFHIKKTGVNVNGINNKFWAWARTDVNGDKKPNTFGRDIFEMQIYNGGTIILYGNSVYSKTHNWKTNAIEWNCATDGISSGRGCGGRIQEEGWKMNY